MNFRLSTQIDIEPLSSESIFGARTTEWQARDHAERSLEASSAMPILPLRMAAAYRFCRLGRLHHLITTPMLKVVWGGVVGAPSGPNAHRLNEVFPNVTADEDDHSAASAASQPSASGHSCGMAAETV